MTQEPSSPGIAALFEQSLSALIKPAAFRAAAERPAPSFAAAGSFILTTGTAAVAVNLARNVAAEPEFLRNFPPAVIAAVSAAGILLYAAAVLLLSILFFAAAKVLGGSGKFDRSLQAAALISVLGPAQMMCNWFPIVWMMPALLAGWAASSGMGAAP